MSRKKRPAPPPPTSMALQTTSDRNQPLAKTTTIGQFIHEDQERPSSRNSSPSSHDSGIPSDSESNLTFASSNEDGKVRQQHDEESSISDARSISTSSPDSLEVLTDQDLIPQAPPCSLLDLSLLHHQPIEIQPYESRSNQILSAKGTLKSTKKKGHSKQQAKEEYHFFLNETDFNQESIDDSVSLVSQEDFAGVKDHTCSRPADGTLTIRSHRVISQLKSNCHEKLLSNMCESLITTLGTVRGVKNRVRAGIATFLRDPNVKNFEEREQGVVVIYVTTLSILRDTWARCVKVRQILRNLLIKVDERDVFMSRENQLELRQRLGLLTDDVSLPQVFLNGQLLGDADIIEKLNETGELRTILRPFKSLTVTTVCGKCGGFRMLPCPVCDGSKKSMHRNDFTEQFIALRCTHCDDCGLVKCDKC